MNSRIAIAILAAVGFVSPALPQDSLAPRAETALSDFHYETVTCAAFFTLGRSCMDAERHRDEITLFDQNIRFLLGLGLEAASAAGLSTDAQIARMKIETEAQAAILEKKCINLASLIARYGARCKRLVDDPDAVFDQYWE